LALLGHPALEASTFLLQHNSQRLGHDLFHAPGFCILGTKLLCAPLVELLYASLDFGTLGKGFATMHESAKLPN